MPGHHFSLFADYHQIVLLDGLAAALPEDVSEEDVHRRLGVSPGAVVVHTARNMTVPVMVEILPEAPEPPDLTAWDHVTECDLVIQTGHVVVAGLTHILETSPHLPLAKGNHRVRAHHGKLDTLSADGLDGDDHYAITIWPGQADGIKVLKQYTGA